VAKKTKDPIRKLLAGVAPTMFLGNPAGTIAIMEERVVEAGGDPEEVLAWVREHGGYPDKTFSVVKRRASCSTSSRRTSSASSGRVRRFAGFLVERRDLDRSKSVEMDSRSPL
jgi:hypothetical protein